MTFSHDARVSSPLYRRRKDTAGSITLPNHTPSTLPSSPTPPSPRKATTSTTVAELLEPAVERPPSPSRLRAMTKRASHSHFRLGTTSPHYEEEEAHAIVNPLPIITTQKSLPVIRTSQLTPTRTHTRNYNPNNNTIPTIPPSSPVSPTTTNSPPFAHTPTAATAVTSPSPCVPNRRPSTHRSPNSPAHSSPTIRSRSESVFKRAFFGRRSKSRRESRPNSPLPPTPLSPATPPTVSSGTVFRTDAHGNSLPSSPLSPHRTTPSITIPQSSPAQMTASPTESHMTPIDRFLPSFFSRRRAHALSPSSSPSHRPVTSGTGQPVSPKLAISSPFNFQHLTHSGQEPARMISLGDVPAADTRRGSITPSTTEPLVDDIMAVLPPPSPLRNSFFPPSQQTSPPPSVPSSQSQSPLPSDQYKPHVTSHKRSHHLEEVTSRTRPATSYPAIVHGRKDHEELPQRPPAPRQKHHHQDGKISVGHVRSISTDVAPVPPPRQSSRNTHRYDIFGNVVASVVVERPKTSSCAVSGRNSPNQETQPSSLDRLSPVPMSPTSTPTKTSFAAAQVQTPSPTSAPTPPPPMPLPPVPTDAAGRKRRPNRSQSKNDIPLSSFAPTVVAPDRIQENVLLLAPKPAINSWELLPDSPNVLPTPNSPVWPLPPSVHTPSAIATSRPVDPTAHLLRHVGSQQSMLSRKSLHSSKSNPSLRQTTSSVPVTDVSVLDKVEAEQTPIVSIEDEEDEKIAKLMMEDSDSDSETTSHVHSTRGASDGLTTKKGLLDIPTQDLDASSILSCESDADSISLKGCETPAESTGCGVVPRASWEDDIDYCYEHEAEAHCDFQWVDASLKQLHGSSPDCPAVTGPTKPLPPAQSEPVSIATAITTNTAVHVSMASISSTSSFSFSKPKSAKNNGGKSGLPPLSVSTQPSFADHTSPSQSSIAISINAPAPNSPTQAPTCLIVPRPSSRASSFKESHGFTLSPSLLIPNDFKQAMMMDEGERARNYDESYMRELEDSYGPENSSSLRQRAMQRSSMSTTTTLASYATDASSRDRHISTFSASTSYTHLTANSSSTSQENLHDWPTTAYDSLSRENSISRSCGMPIPPPLPTKRTSSAAPNSKTRKRSQSKGSLTHGSSSSNEEILTSSPSSQHSTHGHGVMSVPRPGSSGTSRSKNGPPVSFVRPRSRTTSITSNSSHQSSNSGSTYHYLPHVPSTLTSVHSKSSRR